MINIII